MFDNSGRGELLQIVDDNGNQLNFGYNAAGQFGTITTPNGRYVNFSYDSYGRITSIQDTIGRTWSYTYNAAKPLRARQIERGPIRDPFLFGYSERIETLCPAND